MAKQNTDADVDFIKALAELLQENDLTEIEVKREYGEDDKLNVRVSKAKQIVQQAAVQMPAAQAAMAAPSAPTAAADSGDDPAKHPGAVTSPMVGTVYLQAEPGTPPFVKVGDTVAEGDSLLIVEAMKTMNHIHAPHAGTVKRILVADGDPVEYGAPLMIVE
ncbi:MAG: acetyl-CoA carboxylase biotin carboxyl carrier protein [Paracoccaceae bacterium]